MQPKKVGIKDNNDSKRFKTYKPTKILDSMLTESQIREYDRALSERLFKS